MEVESVEKEEGRSNGGRRSDPRLTLLSFCYKRAYQSLLSLCTREIGTALLGEGGVSLDCDVVAGWAVWWVRHQC